MSPHQPPVAVPASRSRPLRAGLDATAEAPGRPRQAWADVAKGICIVLVVLHHLVSKHYPLVVPADQVWLAAAWDEVTYTLQPVRMPLFFLVSGIFAASALRRPLQSAWERRVGGLFLLYAVWLVIHAAYFQAADALPMNRTQDLRELALDLLYASTGLWYLYALVVYFLAAKLLLAVPKQVAVSLAAALAVSAPLFGIDQANRVSVLQHFVYFAVGALYPSIGRRIVELPGRRMLVLALAGAALLALGLAFLDLPGRTTAVLLSIVAVPAALRGVAGLLRWRPVVVTGSYLGSRTLPIYVLHVPVIAALHPVVVSMTSRGTPAAMVTAVYPVLATIVVTGACLLLRGAALRAGLGGLFLPMWPTSAARGPRPDAQEPRAEVRA